MGRSASVDYAAKVASCFTCQWELSEEMNFAIPHLRAGGRGKMLLQDKAPAHTARATQALLQNQNIRQLTIPLESPEINFISSPEPKLEGSPVSL